MADHVDKQQIEHHNETSAIHGCHRINQSPETCKNSIKYMLEIQLAHLILSCPSFRFTTPSLIQSKSFPKKKEPTLYFIKSTVEHYYLQISVILSVCIGVSQPGLVLLQGTNLFAVVVRRRIVQ